MRDLIRNGNIVEDDETYADLSDFLAVEPRSDRVWLDADQEVEALSPYLDSIKVIALNFPAFSDGRAYSGANLLRQKYGYTGEIRAIGDVRIDQLDQMVRCGFDAFLLAEGQSAERALKQLGGFSFSYQPTVDRPPLFRHRANQGTSH